MPSLVFVTEDMNLPIPDVCPFLTEFVTWTDIWHFISTH